jgi:hypothetical protein
MNIQELKANVCSVITELKDNGNFPKENNHIDYKKELTIATTKTDVDNFMMNFAKDIISFSNSDGGIVLLGIKENKSTGEHQDIGLNEANINLLAQIDLNDITQQFEKITKVGVSIDLQKFQISTRFFYYLLIEKNHQILLPQKDYPSFKLIQGAVYYRASSKTEHANKSTSDFNRFLQIKANERSKEFMDIWSKLLPEMVDINPREVLILNPIQNKVYGFNSKDKTLSSSDVEIDKTKNGVFNVILNAISAGEIGRITTTEGKPIYKIVGELKHNKNHTTLSNLEKLVKDGATYKFTNQQLKVAIHHLGWVSVPQFKIQNPPEGTVVPGFDKFIWVENEDVVRESTKIFFSPDAADEIITIINDKSLHQDLFNKCLDEK